MEYALVPLPVTLVRKRFPTRPVSAPERLYNRRLGLWLLLCQALQGLGLLYLEVFEKLFSVLLGEVAFDLCFRLERNFAVTAVVFVLDLARIRLVFIRLHMEWVKGRNGNLGPGGETHVDPFAALVAQGGLCLVHLNVPSNSGKPHVHLAPVQRARYPLLRGSHSKNGPAVFGNGQSPR